ncbi:outer membrane lipoprotein carrier protein LolA [Phaeovibrio sulfidiphilus]|uniref:Outer membrane lipoprotein carrier protein LolA n=1 Tax=Phaeovibrio sulfidiphilus TaxID=1220600 RepID=A0A8J6YNZ1_9PROT|nr:outer membrane lipoprotein carrier protein LolA [Phaeovibrio sulfidiphilus]MBE1237284.1 outer membrane lipoprotein carrier protein LolA [Phaeovibrio sulfidiphilus]
MLPFHALRRARRATLAVLAALALAALALPGPARADDAPARPLTAQEQAFLKQAEGYLNTFRMAKARFIQTASTGETLSGTLALARPNRLRMNYDPPSPLTLVANGTHLIYIDAKMEQVTYIDLDTTPLSVFLADRISFADPAITITNVETSDKRVEVTLHMTKDPGIGSLTLAFDREPLALAGWRVLDAQGISVTVSLFNIDRNPTLDPDLFVYRRPDPRNLPR